MEEESIKTTLKVRKDIFLKAKVLASVRGESLTDIINEALAAYLKAHEDEIREKLTEVIQ